MEFKSLVSNARGLAFRASWQTAVSVEHAALAARDLTLAGAALFRDARRARLHLVELAGVVLVSYGVSLWCVPAALILGGLVLVVAVEVRPHVAPQLPRIPPPDELLRAQAEQAARAINAARYGVPACDEKSLARLSRADCERLAATAAGMGKT